MRTYAVSTQRILMLVASGSLVILAALVLFFMLGAFWIGIEPDGPAILLLLTAYLLTGVLPALVLLLQHRRSLKGITVTYDAPHHHFLFTRGGITRTINRHSIIAVYEYSPMHARVPWYGIRVWEIETRNGSAWLSSALMPQQEMRTLFAGNPIEEDFRLFPTIPGDPFPLKDSVPYVKNVTPDPGTQV